MRKLEELGVSPTPWFVDSDGNVGCDYICHAFRPNERRRRIVASPNLYFGQCGADARLIAAAPKLYNALRDAVIEMCHDCPNCGGYPKYGCKKPDCECFPAEWRAVLAKAAGENTAK